MDPVSQMNVAYNVALFPGIFSTFEESNDFLSTLDSDTKDYVLKHTSDFSTRGELMECVRKLHEGR